MTEPTFEQLRLPIALILIIVVAFIFLPQGSDEGSTAASDVTASPTLGPTAGEPAGAVTESAPSTPLPTLTPVPTPRATPTPRPTAAAARDGFDAEVLACRSIAGSSCNGRLGTLPAGAGTFTALVRFTDATAGDAIHVVLDGPGGTIAGGPYRLGGSGDGFYYSTFSVGGLPTGEYTVTAIRNGSEVAQTSFRRGG
jgi:hypothetical protein